MPAAGGERQQSPLEEAANSLSHATGFVLAAVAWPVLLSHASGARAEPDLHALAVGLFAATMMLLYLSSALFHGLPAGRGKRVFERLDHAAIYLFIAGSYSAFAARTLHEPAGWYAFGLIWSLAITGALLTLLGRPTRRGLSTGLYIALGWVVLLAAIPTLSRIAADGVWLLVVGGLAYTLGAGLFLLSTRVRFAHLGWHLFVLAGSALHFTAMLLHS